MIRNLAQRRATGRLPTGLTGLDEKLGGGFPAGSTVLVQSNSETAVRTFCQQVAYIQALEGRDVFYVAIIREPAYIREEMQLFGWDPAGSDAERSFHFVDAYSSRVQVSKEPEGYEEPRLQAHHLIRFDPFVILRNAVLNRLREGDTIVMDSLSDLLLFQQFSSSLELLEVLAAKVRAARGMALLPLLEDLHSRETIATIAHLADAVVEFEMEETNFEGKLMFWKIRRSGIKPLVLPFSVSERGILAETFTRVS